MRIIDNNILTQFGINQLVLITGRGGGFNSRQKAQTHASGQARDLAIGQCAVVDLHLIDSACEEKLPCACRGAATDANRLRGRQNRAADLPGSVRLSIHKQLKPSAIVGHGHMVLGTRGDNRRAVEHPEAGGRSHMSTETPTRDIDHVLAFGKFAILADDISGRHVRLHEGTDGQARSWIERSRVGYHDILTVAVEIQTGIHMTGTEVCATVDGAGVSVAGHVVGDDADAFIEGPVTSQTVAQTGICRAGHDKWQQGRREESEKFAFDIHITSPRLQLKSKPAGPRNRCRHH